MGNQRLSDIKFDLCLQNVPQDQQYRFDGFRNVGFVNEDGYNLLMQYIMYSKPCDPKVVQTII